MWQPAPLTSWHDEAMPHIAGPWSPSSLQPLAMFLAVCSACVMPSRTQSVLSFFLFVFAYSSWRSPFTFGGQWKVQCRQNSEFLMQAWLCPQTGEVSEDPEGVLEQLHLQQCTLGPCGAGLLSFLLSPLAILTAQHCMCATSP
jgi:hypothetical protein